ncbi:hypothetical protein EHS13_13915 [Paenibacillus psychroresistens]|uniref:Uncharacterized protein n=1 Tax=Paenibacillus psychroresistens TaxID=1778678 RepID=A0A6B8RJZ4_9BACL|nr:hypothetical protein [Paenibacillus psychroresistens]QGQ95893.1 hypothetical protein EHS13_13915 [Paenibacillus psychroresistens]
MKIYYDQLDDGLLAPIWMLLPIHTLEWQLERFYVSFNSPYEQFTTNVFDAKPLYIIVQMEDLFRNWKERESIGISLHSIHKRFNTNNEELIISDIEYMLVRILDIEEVLQMNIQSLFSFVETNNEMACLAKW